jgi:hypothetical protein
MAQLAGADKAALDREGESRCTRGESSATWCRSGNCWTDGEQEFGEDLTVLARL